MTAKRTGGNVTQLPTKVHYSLLSDVDEDVEPFVAEISEDVTITLTDPTELSVEELAELREPLGFLRSTAPDEETRAVLRKLSAKNFGKVMRAYFSHFGLEGAPDKTPGLGF